MTGNENLQSTHSNDLCKFNIERAYGPWFDVGLLATGSQEVPKALREETQLFLVSFLLVDTLLESGHHSHRVVFL